MPTIKEKQRTAKENYVHPVTGMARIIHPKFVDTFWFIAESIANEVMRTSSRQIVFDHINLYGFQMASQDDRPPGSRLPYYCQGMLELVIEILREKGGDQKIIKVLEASV